MSSGLQVQSREGVDKHELRVTGTVQREILWV